MPNYHDPYHPVPCLSGRVGVQSVECKHESLISSWGILVVVARPLDVVGRSYI